MGIARTSLCVASPAPRRLESLDGLRAYLAGWVLITHVLWASGYDLVTLSGFARILRQGEMAVEVFIILSGFVIFLLLDKQEESYRQYLVRRFFRLFPLYVVLFFAAIPLSRLTEWNVLHARSFLSDTQIAHVTQRVEAWWFNIAYHIPVHLLLLQGLVPERVLAESPGAFLDAAWTTSLEWQFYIVAPLLYALYRGGGTARRIALGLGALALLLARNHLFSQVMYGAALPCHLGVFLFGAATYLFYRRYGANRRSRVSYWPVCVAAIALLALRPNSLLVAGISIWTLFMSALMSHRSATLSAVFAVLFTNRLVRYLGRISYSIYLVHMLVVVVAQNALLHWRPQLSQRDHFALLLLSTVVFTIVTSALLYRFVEAPGITAGRRLAAKLGPRRLSGQVRYSPAATAT